jgi:3-dehydroquinate synthase
VTSPVELEAGDAEPTRIPVTAAGFAPYEVVIGSNILSEVGPILAGCTRVLVLHAAPVVAAAKRIEQVLRRNGVETVRLFELPDGEAAKTLDVAARGWELLGELGATRDDAVVGIGGGAVTDLAGFVAATWLRGVRVVQVPTTVAGIVDAAVGGKTGINTAAGKNLVGSFHQPAAVICDLDLLATLPAEEFRGGLAEIVKGGFIADPVILDLFDDDPSGQRHFRELAERKVRIKANVVSADGREAGLREILNYGHTLAHAIERHENYRWRHGDAVSVGLVFAAELGRQAGRLPDADADRHRDLLSRMGLPVSYPAAAWPALQDVMKIDKKTRGHLLRFVVLDGIGTPGILEGPDQHLLDAAYAAVADGGKA